MKQIACLFFFFSLIFSIHTYGQEKGNLVSGNFNNASFNEFVQKIESGSSFHFYYDPSQFDSVNITVSFNEAHLESILDKIFSKTRWHYLIDNDNHVFITKGFSLAAKLKIAEIVDLNRKPAKPSLSIKNAMRQGIPAATAR